MNEYVYVPKEELTPIADAIRTLTNTTDKIGLDAMKTHLADANTEVTEQDTLVEELLAALDGKASGGSADPVLQEKTVSPSTSKQTVTADSGYDGLSSVTVNAMTTATQATPSISVSTGGLITASATQTAGYVTAGTKSATKQLTVQAAQTITPGTSNKTIASGRYLTGTQTIKGDANLKADNITEGVSIFGIAGANPYEKTATTTEVNTQATKLAELKTILQGKATGGSGGNLETCSLTLIGDEMTLMFYGYCHTLVNGENVIQEIPSTLDPIYNGSEVTYIIPNVICGADILLGNEFLSALSNAFTSENIDTITDIASGRLKLFRANGDGIISYRQDLSEGTIPPVD